MLTKKIFSLAMLFALLICSIPTHAGIAVNTETVKKTKLKIAGGEKKKEKIRGFITNIISPTSFEIDDYKITKDETLVLDFENQGADIKFKPEDLRIGTEIQVQGLLDEETNELKATKVTIDLEQFRKLKNTTVLTRDPENVVKTDKGWQGVFWADGRRIRVEPATQVLFEPNKSEKKELSQKSKDSKNSKTAKDSKKTKIKENSETPVNGEKDPATPEIKENKQENAETQITGEKTGDLPDEDEFTGSEPLKEISDVKAGMFATYEGVEQADGTVLASRIIFMKNELESAEGKFWQSLGIKEKAANFANASPGELKIDRIGKFKLLPDKQVQEFVTRIGESLIPAHQKSLAPGDPQRIPFRFYVVSDKDANAFATANGIVVINSGMLVLLENEAQLAAVIAHEISHATQEHTWRQLNKDKGKRTAVQIGGIAAAAFGLYGVSNLMQLTMAAMVNGYQRRLENQADRIGLEYMTAAGYDPREAPRVWKLMAKRYGSAPTNFFWSSHENPAARRSFMMVEIRNNYSQTDLNLLKKGDESEYEKIVFLTRDAAAKKKKIKVKLDS